MLKSNFETTILDLEGSVSKVAALKILWTKIPLPDNVCPFYQIIWQRLWHILIIKYSDNVCDISISSSILTMSVTYLYHQIFWQCLRLIYIIQFSDNVCDILVSSTALTKSVSYPKFVTFIQFAIVKTPTQPRDFLPRHWGSIERQV